MARQIVTLTTDWADKGYHMSAADNGFLPKTYPLGDHYIAQLKGILLQISLSVEIVDVTHSIQSFNRIQAAFVMRNVYPFYPRGTIHLIGVNSEPSPKNKMVIIRHDGHYFVGAAEGIFGMVFDEEPEEVRELEPEDGLYGYAALKMFAVAVNNIVAGRDFSVMGKLVAPERRFFQDPTYGEDFISGRVVLIDYFGNLITNVSRELFDYVRKKRAFRIVVMSVVVTELSYYYDDADEHQHLVLFNSMNILEIAMRNSNLARLESIDVGTGVRVDFDGRLFF